MKNLFLFLVVQLFFSCIVWGQSVSTSDTPQLLKELNKKANEVQAFDPDSAIVMTKRALEIANRLNRPADAGAAYLNWGLAEMTLGNWEAAQGYYEKALSQFRETGDSVLVARACNQLAYSYQARGFYNISLDYHLKALTLREKYEPNSSNLAASLGGVGFQMMHLGDLEQAMEYQQKALNLRLSLDSIPSVGVAFTMKNIGYIYEKRGEYDVALVHLQQALDTFKVYDKLQFVEIMNRSIGNIYVKIGNLEQAEMYYSKALEMVERLKGEGIRSRVCNAFGNLYFLKKDYLRAIEWSEKALTAALIGGKISVEQKESCERLALAHRALGNYESAFGYFQQYDAVKGTLLNETSARQVSELKMTYEVEQQELEIEKLRALQTQREQERNFLIGGLIMVLIFSFFIFYVNQRRKTAFRALLKEKHKSDQLLKEKETLVKELQDTQVQLVQSEKMASLGQLTAGVAHEINNPINFIASSVQALKLDFQELEVILQKVAELNIRTDSVQCLADLQILSQDIDLPYLREEIKELIGGVERGANRTHNIVTSLRTFSRSVGERFAAANIHEGLDATLVILNSKLDHRITVKKNYGDLPPINCQFEKLNQVFMNILNNAIDAIAGEGAIMITTEVQNKQTYIRIEDTGQGMNETTRQRIFEPFFTTKDVGKGTGLGLSISYGIIEQHGGTIVVNSVDGEGTEFVIVLPNSTNSK